MGLPVIRRFIRRQGKLVVSEGDDDSVGWSPIVVECRKCRTPLSTPGQTVSRLFQGTSGPATLYASVLNTAARGAAGWRQLTTGEHVVQDVQCAVCRRPLGWTYLEAGPPDQRYKVGKTILEQAFVQESCQLTGAVVPKVPSASLPFIVRHAPLSSSPSSTVRRVTGRHPPWSGGEGKSNECMHQPHPSPNGHAKGGIILGHYQDEVPGTSLDLVN
jgi:hypothetical protein